MMILRRLPLPGLVGRIAVRMGPAGGPAIRGPRPDGKQQPAVLGGARIHPRKASGKDDDEHGGRAQLSGLSFLRAGLGDQQMRTATEQDRCRVARLAASRLSAKISTASGLAEYCTVSGK